jgi:predicted PurR-regulated permease PerM
VRTFSEAEMAAILERPSRTTERSLAVLALGAALAFCWLSREVLVPALLGVFAAYAVHPIVVRLERRRVPRPAAAVAGALTAIVVVAAVLAILWTQLDAFAAELPAYESRLRGISRRIAGHLSTVQRRSEELVPAPAARDGVKVTPGVPWGTLLLGTAQSAAAVGMGALIAVFTLYFSLADGPRYRAKLLAAAPTPAARARTAAAFRELHHDLGQYLVNRVLLNSGAGLVAALAYAAFGLRHAAIWGVTTAVCRFVPFVGTALGLALPVLMAVLQYGTLRDPLLVAAIYLAIVFVQGNVVDPIFLGRQLRMNSLAVFLGSLFWYWIWGPVGLLLAVPLLSAIRIACAHVPRLRLVADLLGE